MHLPRAKQYAEIESINIPLRVAGNAFVDDEGLYSGACPLGQDLGQGQADSVVDPGPLAHTCPA